MPNFLRCLLLLFVLYFLGSYWAKSLPQGAEQITAWVIAGCISSLLLLIVYGIAYVVNEYLLDTIEVERNSWIWTILIALGLGLYLTPHFVYPTVIGYVVNPAAFWNDVKWITGIVSSWSTNNKEFGSGIWHAIVWIVVGIWNIIVWIVVGIWNILVWLFGRLIALIVSILTAIVVPTVVTLIGTDAVGSQRILPLKGVYSFLNKRGWITTSQEEKQEQRKPEQQEI